MFGFIETRNPGCPLDQEQLDSLRLDCQDQSPRQINFLRDLTSLSHDALLNFYGQYIPIPMTNKEVFNRFIFAHPPAYRTFSDHWIKAPIFTTYLEPKSKGLMRAYDVREGHLIIGYIPKNIWKGLTEDNKAELIQSCSGPKKAKHFIQSLQTIFQITHETVHLYQKNHPDLPLWFLECAAYFYTDAVITKMKWGELEAPFTELPVMFYTWLIEKYGADVHRLCFGSPVGQKAAKRILTAMTPKKMALVFPTMRTERP